MRVSDVRSKPAYTATPAKVAKPEGGTLPTLQVLRALPRTWASRGAIRAFTRQYRYIFPCARPPPNSYKEQPVAHRQDMATKRTTFTFIDLFAGIGGMRIAFEMAGGTCVFSSEINEQSRKTYEANFGDTPSGDIREVRASSIPDHDILVAGFPCQPFSLAGVSKKRSMNMGDGFHDSEQGLLFFEILRILKAKRPHAFLLENVKNLRFHDKGKTLKYMIRRLELMGYRVKSTVIDASSVVPQHRERIYIAGFLDQEDFAFPTFSGKKPKLKNILLKSVPQKYTLTNGVWAALKRHAKRSRDKGYGFGYGIADLNGTTRTLSARYHKDGAEILIKQAHSNPRRLTPKECARLMGFPKNFDMPVSDVQAYRQLGNAVVPPVVEKIAVLMRKKIQQRHMRTHIKKHTRILEMNVS